MSDKNNEKLPSLRSRYLILASLVTILLLIGAAIASWYITDVSKNNEKALAINDTITTTVSDLRTTLSNINMTVSAMLIRPEASHETTIDVNLKSLMHSLTLLQANADIQSTNLKRPLEKVHNHIVELSQKIRHLIKQRKKPEWVYPILPYINEKLLIANRNFISSTELAINEYVIGEIAVDETYHHLQDLRNLWQRKILNFRAVIVRFAGLNNTTKTTQEAGIDNTHNRIEAILSVLKEKQKNNALELQTESSISIMSQASSEWYKHWSTVRQIRRSTYWRGDIAYLNQYLAPLQQRTNDSLKELESMVRHWSGQQTGLLSDAAKSILTELWILIILAISFVIAVYLMIEKFVIKPTISISKALSEDGHEQYFNIEDKSSKEVFRLTSAFNSMRKQIHQRQIALEHQALHDALTGLPNRALLNDRLTQAINIMKRNDDPLAILLLDLNRFKEVNDTLGHHVGDQLLQLVAKRLEKTVRNSDTVARLGGDEFAIIAPNTSPSEAILFSKKIETSLKNVFTIDNQNIFVGVSSGISIYPDHGTDIHTLLRHADTAMYVAKENNLGSVLYEELHDRNSPDNLSLVGDLHNAIEDNDELHIFYQPQIDLLNHEIVQVEALLRWNHPAKGLILPEQIIQLAEHTGMIKELTFWVIDAAVQEYMQHLFKRNIRLAINLSAWNLQDPDLPQTIATIIKEHEMPANMLTLEITETAMMSDPIRARSVLHKLNEMNIILAIDDYGTGFSSLSYLKLLPVHELKIDKSFIFDMLENENDAIIVKSTIELAHNLGFKVIAEGVENNETLLQLRTHKCDYIQGYHISKPQDIYQLIAWLQSYQPQISQ